MAPPTLLSGSLAVPPFLYEMHKQFRRLMYMSTNEQQLLRMQELIE